MLNHMKTIGIGVGVLGCMVLGILILNEVIQDRSIYYFEQRNGYMIEQEDRNLHNFGGLYGRRIAIGCENIQISNADKKHLAVLKNRIFSLGLCNVRLKDLQFTFPQLSNLTIIDRKELSGIDQESLKRLIPPPKHVFISGQKVGEPPRFISSEVMTLHLRHTDISDDIFCAIPNLSNLLVLELESNEIGDKVLFRIANECSQVNECVIRGENLPESGIAFLRHKIPNAQVSNGTTNEVQSNDE